MIVGLLSARDSTETKPVKLLRERRGAKYEDLIVDGLMVPRHAIDVLGIDAVRGVEVESILATLKGNARQHALVLETAPLRGVEIVRGIFSATQIARQLGVATPIFELAQTFAEITSALEK